jgi:hypothetical protein
MFDHTERAVERQVALHQQLIACVDVSNLRDPKGAVAGEHHLRNTSCESSTRST